MLQRDFIAEHCNAPDTIARAVIRQLGGWASFQESAPDITRHGVDGGFSGFIYYRDTVAFTKRNMPALREMVQDMAREFGQGVGEFLASFGCLRGSYNADECAQAFYSGKGEAAEAVYNALAWFAAEEVARAFDNAS